MKTMFCLLLLCLALPLSAADPAKPHIVFIAGDPEYYSIENLSAFQHQLETNYGFRCTFLQRVPSNDSIPGIEALDSADLLVLFVRRMTLPDEQLNRVRQYLNRGKPLLGLRTASHAFQGWKEFDPQVLGGNYKGHHGNTLVATAHIEPKSADHPILKNVPVEFVTGGSLYKPSPLATNTTLLMTASVTNQPAEPVAWTHFYNKSRVFYTSLGHPKDFENPGFRQMLLNAVFWTLDRPMPASK